MLPKANLLQFTQFKKTDMFLNTTPLHEYIIC